MNELDPEELTLISVVQHTQFILIYLSLRHVYMHYTRYFVLFFLRLLCMGDIVDFADL